MKTASTLRIHMAALTLAITTSLGLLAPSEASATRYYDRNAEGWFWYDDPKPAKEPEAKKKEPKKEEPKVIVMQAPEPAEAEPAEPATLSAAWFRENLQVYMDRAIDNPTKQNVEAYFLLQRVMMDKAQEFSDMSRFVVMGDPILDESTRRSFDQSTSRLQETNSAKHRERVLTEVLKKAGLAFFFSEDCELCANQGQYLKFLADRTGIEIMPVSLDGKPLPNGVFADTMIVDSGQAESIGVKSGPALFLLAPPDKWIPLSYAVITQEEVISRVLMGAVEAGLISNEELDLTKPINVTPSLANVLPEDGKLPDDPNELIRFLRNLEKDK